MTRTSSRHRVQIVDTRSVKVSDRLNVNFINYVRNAGNHIIGRSIYFVFGQNPESGSLNVADTVRRILPQGRATYLNIMSKIVLNALKDG